MKKIFTTLCLASLCLGAASAQGLKVTVDGNPVTNGTTVTSSNLEVTEIDGVVYLWELKPETHITVDENTTIIVTVTNLEGKSNVTYVGKDSAPADISFCGINVMGGMPGQCMTVAPGKSETMNQTLKSGDVGELQCYFMSGDFEHPVPQLLDVNTLVKIEAEGENGSEETFEFTLNMVYPSTGVNGVAAESADFSVAGGSIVANGDVEVYDLAGRRVANNGLQGMYIVRVNGRAAKVAVK